MLLSSVKIVQSRIVRILLVCSTLEHHHCVSGISHESPDQNGHLDDDRTGPDEVMAAAFHCEEGLHLTENDGDRIKTTLSDAE